MQASNGANFKRRFFWRQQKFAVNIKPRSRYVGAKFYKWSIEGVLESYLVLKKYASLNGANFKRRFFWRQQKVVENRKPSSRYVSAKFYKWSIERVLVLFSFEKVCKL
jgi:hypothetical protein